MGLEEIIRRFRDLRVLVVGDFIADEYVYCQASRVSREAPVPVLEVERTAIRPGGAGNVAMNLCAMGAQVACVGVLGDAEGSPDDLVRDALRDAGVKIRGMYPASADRKVRVLAAAPGARLQQVARIDHRAEWISGTPSRRERIVGELCGNLRGALGAQRPQLVVVSDYGLGVCGPEVLDALRAAVRGDAHLRVAVDARRDLVRYQGLATSVKINETELAESAVGNDVLARAADLALTLGSQLGALLVTCGGRGAVLLEHIVPDVESCDAMAVWNTTELRASGGDAVDVTGAGDSVHAAFALALVAGAPPLAAAHLAMVAGGLAVSRLGTTVVSADDLLRAATTPASPPPAPQCADDGVAEEVSW